MYLIFTGYYLLSKNSELSLDVVKVLFVSIGYFLSQKYITKMLRNIENIKEKWLKNIFFRAQLSERVKMYTSGNYYFLK